jgi:cell division ATPase FtsA
MDLLDPWRGNLRVVQDAPLALYNLLAYEGLVGEPAVVLDMGSATTDVLVINPPRYWVRTLLVAGDDLTNALVEQFGITTAEAETIKRRVAKSAHRDQILRVLEPVFDDMVNEVQRSLGYYKSLAREVKFERVLAIGSALKMTGLNQMLAAGLQYQVQTVRGLNRIQVAGGVDAEQLAAALPGCCTALGLLVQGAGQGQVRINMIPEEVALARQMAKKKPWLLAAAVGLLVTAVVLGLGEFLHAQEFPQARGRVNWGFFEEVRKTNQSYNSEFRAAKGVEDKLKALAEGGIPRDLLLQVLPVFANSLHDDVYVTQLRLEWVEPAQVASLAPIGKLGTRVARVSRAAPVGPVAAGPVGGADEDAELAAREAQQAADDASIMSRLAEEDAVRGAARASAMASRGRGRAGRAGPAPGGPRTGGPVGPRTGAPAGGTEMVSAPPARTADSELVVRFACESRTISKTFIEEQVLPGLRNAQLPPDWRAAFKEVKMLGDVRDVYRETATGEETGGSGDDVRRFLAFEGYAVVNLGQAAPAPK